MRNQGDGSYISRPITEYFFRKVLADKKLGIDKAAKFVKPAEMENEMMMADITISETDPTPAAECDGCSETTEQDYEYDNNTPPIGPESKPPVDDDKPVKKDTITKTPVKKEEPNNTPIGSKVEEPKKKKGLLKRIFGSKDN